MIFSILNRYKYSLIILSLIAITIALAVGGYQYNRYLQREQYYRRASHEYGMFIDNLERNNIVSKELAADFIKKYKESPYTSLLQLHLAAQAVKNSQLEEALEYLTQATHSRDPEIRCIARQRKAKVLGALNRLEEAISFLEKEPCPYCEASIESLKGDLFYAMKDKVKALQAYKKAQTILPELEALQPILQMKIDELDNLPETLSTV